MPDGAFVNNKHVFVANRRVIWEGIKRKLGEIIQVSVEDAVFLDLRDGGSKLLDTTLLARYFCFVTEDREQIW